MKKQLTLIIIFLFMSVFSFANNDSTKTSNTKVESVIQEKNSVIDRNNKSLSELDYYKLLYDKEKSNGNSYVSLIQWIFGVCSAFLLAIIGSQIFFNYRISKQEIASIKNDIEDRISEIKIYLLENIENKFITQNLSFKNDFDKTEKQFIKKIETINENFADLKSNIKSDFDKTEEHLIKKTETINENFADFKSIIRSDLDKTEKYFIDKAETLNDNFTDFKSDIKSNFKKTEKQLVNTIDNQFHSKNELTELQIEMLKTSLSRKIKDIEINVAENEGYIWELRGVSSNALTSFINSAIIQIELKMEVKYILNNIIKTLTKLDEIHKSDYKKLDSLTKKIKQSHKEQFDQIVNLYSSKPIYLFEAGVKKII